MPQFKNETKIQIKGKNESMNTALALVKEGISIRESAKLTNLAYATVRRYWVKGKQQAEQKQNNDITNSQQTQQVNTHHKIAQARKRIIKRTWNKIFTPEQEVQLAEICKGVTALQCRKLIYQMAVENKVKIHPNWHFDQLAGRDWLANFQKRHRVILSSSHQDEEDNTKKDKIVNDEPVKKSPTIGLTTRKPFVCIPIKTEIAWSGNNYNNEHSNTNQYQQHRERSNSKEMIIENDQPYLNDDDDISNRIRAPLPALNPLELCSISATAVNNDSSHSDIGPAINNNYQKCSTENHIHAATSIASNSIMSTDFQTGILNTLNYIANLASKENERAKDPDELFLLSLLPAMRKVKEEDKLKVRIELIKVLDHF